MNADPDSSDLLQCGTFPEWVQHRASLHGDRTALTFLPDDYFAGDDDPVRITYGDLWRQAGRRAAMIRRQLAERSAPVADSADPRDAPRVLMLYPTGIEFVVAFLAAQLADCIPVPTAFPRPHREIPRLNGAARDCRPSLLLTDQATAATIARDKLEDSIKDIPVLATDSAADDFAGGEHVAAEALELSPACRSPQSIAFLQYTSGSTSRPNGVVIRQRNLMANLESIRDGFQLTFPSHQASDGDPSLATAVFWLPFYHDMGLIGGILEPLYIGGHSVLISPRAFLQRPIRWLQTISDYRATISGAPNFAYQLCVDRIAPDQTDSLSLDSWQLAFCGAEPITAKTLIDFERRFSANGFSENVFYPCYGLAEATLLVSGPRGPRGIDVLSLDRAAYQTGRVRVLPRETALKIGKRNRQDLVACGTQVKDTEVVTVDRDTKQPLQDDVIGEIWVRGRSVADGYWSEINDDPGGESERFRAALADGRSDFFRTGDLGFFHDGQLFVSGRVKELIILRGRNLYPQDIEATTLRCIREFLSRPDASPEETVVGKGAAFSVPASRSEALAIVAELPRGAGEIDFARLIREIRREVIEDHEVDPHHIALVRLASIPLTTSGKIRRGACRQAFLEDALKTHHRWNRATFYEQAPIPFPELPDSRAASDDSVRVAVRSWMSEWLISRAGVSPEEFCPTKPLGDYGLDSLTAVELSGETEDWTGVTLTPEVAIANPSVEALSGYIAERYTADRHS